MTDDEPVFPDYEVVDSAELDAAPPSPATLTSEEMRAKLRETSELLDDDDFGTDELRVLIGHLERLCFAEGGYGLSAVQIGFPVAVFVIGDQAGRGVYINPRIESHGRDVEERDEACLSLPGVRVLKRRWRVITASWQDEQGRRHMGRLSGLTARVFQHEYDHLNGLLITDELAGVPEGEDT